jgi:nucleoside-diphosphate-sugar epimerase
MTEVNARDSNPHTLERMVLNAQDVTGIVLRYGSFYGLGTSLSPGGKILEMVLRRQLLVGNGAGVRSFIHIDDAAHATQLAIEHGTPGLYNIVDDDPTEVAVWLPELARAIGAKPPYHVPWLGRLVIGDAGLSIMTTIRGSSNAKAKRILGWQPEYASWRYGFRRGLVAGQQPSHRSS